MATYIVLANFYGSRRAPRQGHDELNGVLAKLE